MEEVSSNISGVFQIVNKLSVIPYETYIDQTISEDVLAALERNIYVNVKDITVCVENQIVTLSGKVPNWTAYNAASEVAKFTPGVIDVQNNLVLGISDNA